MSTKIEGFGHTGAVRLDRQLPVERSGSHHDGPVEAATKSDSVQLTGEAEQMYAIERGLRNSDGIDTGRVSKIRNALADGSYKIDPDAIATNLLALDRALFD